MVPGVDDLGLDAQPLTVRRGLDVQLGDVETQGIETTHPRLHLGVVTAGVLLGSGELVPQLVVPVLDRRHQAQRIEGGVEHVTLLQVEELAVKVGAGDLQIVFPLSGGEAVMELAGLGVDQIGREGLGVASEQYVRQRDVSPEESHQVQPYQQDDEGVEQPHDGPLTHTGMEQGPVRQ